MFVGMMAAVLILGVPAATMLRILERLVSELEAALSTLVDLKELVQWWAVLLR